MSKTQKISKLTKISNNKELKSSKASNDAFVDIFKSWPFLSIEANVKKPDGNKSSEDEKPPQAGGSSGDKQTTVPSSESQRYKDHVVQRNAQLEKQHLLKEQKGNPSIQPTNKQREKWQSRSTSRWRSQLTHSGSLIWNEKNSRWPKNTLKTSATKW